MGATVFAPEFDAGSEQASLAAALLAARASFAPEYAAEHVLASLCDLAIAASPHLRLAWFYVGDPDAAAIRPLYAAGPEKRLGEQLAVDKSRLMLCGPVRRALAERRAVEQRIPRARGITRRLAQAHDEWCRLMRLAGIGAVYAIPFELAGSSESAVAILCADRADYFELVGAAPFSALAELAQARLDHAATADCERRAREQAEQLSLYDTLTGLPNGLLLRDRITQALSQSREAIVGLALIKIRNIDTIANPAARAEALIETGIRLRQLLAPTDTAACLGDGEFAVLCVGRRSEAAAEQVFERLFDALDREIAAGDARLRLVAGVGVSVARAGQPAAEALLHQAELALRRALLADGSRWYFFEPSHQSEFMARHELAAEIERALNHDELRLYYQPQLRLDAGAADGPVAGLEALIRWEHPRDGLLPPGHFVPAIEQSALIERIGEWTLDAALQQLRVWNARGLKLRVGVNIAARHLLAAGFADYIRSLFDRYRDVEPQQLEIELTESAALAGLDRANIVLTACRELGVGVALDDFGTGHASLTYLQQLPANRVKIDKDFVTELESRAANLAIIAGTVIGAGLLGLDVVAEGVESEAHGLMLAKIGCTSLQGYAISRPLPAEQVPDWLQRWQTPASWLRWAARPFQPQALPLLTAQISHRHLTEELVGATAAVRTDRCVFDQWYYGTGRHLFWAYSAYLPIAEAHQAYHVAADELTNALANGQRRGLGKLRVRLREQTELLIERLESLQLIAMGSKL